MFLRKETDLKHSVKLLQNEIKDLNERLDTDPDDLNQSQSSMIFKKIVDMSSPQGENGDSVSYTHLTLPTIYSV